jgi:hypothetical protein
MAQIGDNGSASFDEVLFRLMERYV